MSFTKTNNMDNRNYLCEEDLKEIKLKKICYVVDYSAGTSKLKEGFYRLLVKSVDGLTLSAMVFNPIDFINRGLDIAYLKNKFISIGGYPQVYNGKYSIIVETVDIVDSSIISNEVRMNFLGSIPDIDDIFETMSSLFGKYNLKLPEVYKYSTYSSIYSGRVGGYVKFISNWLCSLGVYFDEYGEDLIKLFYYSVIYYNKLLARKAELDVITARDRFDIIRGIPTNISEVSYVLEDVLMSIFDLSTPEHILSHILYNTFKSNRDLMYLQESWRTMPMGGVLKSDGLTLRKY